MNRCVTVKAGSSCHGERESRCGKKKKRLCVEKLSHCMPKLYPARDTQSPCPNTERNKQLLEAGDELLGAPKGVPTPCLSQWTAHTRGRTLRARAAETIKQRTAEVIKHRMAEEKTYQIQP